MTTFLKDHNQYRFFPGDSLDIHTELPAGTYVLKESILPSFLYLVPEKSFDASPKLYGNLIAYRDRIFNTFLDRDSATGVLLSGEKGSGKTLLAREIAIKAQAAGYPTITINSEIFGDGLNNLIHNMSQNTIIIFDEFEKVYKKENQDAILSLLDGLFTSKKMFILTINDMWGLSDYLKNRPGRLFYYIKFEGLDSKFISEYCDDKLKTENMKFKERLIKLSSFYPAFNFDMLKALVEEVNRYSMDPVEAIKMLNVKPEADYSTYQITVYSNGKVIHTNTDDKINPLNLKDYGIYMDTDNILLNAGDLQNIEADKGKFTFKVGGNGRRRGANAKEYTIVIERMKKEMKYERFIDI